MREASGFFRRQHAPIPGTCFVLMPFEEALSAVYEHGIKPLVESMDIKCRRADEMYSAQGILGDIWQSIQSAEIIIADLTGKNPNVMYELGLCHALWKRVILLSQNKDDVPFDLRAWRVLWYDFTFAGAARLKDELKRAIDAMRAEAGVESDLIPLRGSGQSAGGAKTHNDPAASESHWLTGTIEHWRPGEFGFIKVGQQGYYFNPDYLFSTEMLVETARPATFIPLEPLEPGKSPRASRVFVTGSQLRAHVTRVIRAKGYCFADVAGQRGEIHKLLVIFPDDAPDLEHSEIECRIDSNAHGPIGRFERIIGDAPFS